MTNVAGIIVGYNNVSTLPVTSLTLQFDSISTAAAVLFIAFMNCQADAVTFSMSESSAISRFAAGGVRLLNGLPW